MMMMILISPFSSYFLLRLPFPSLSDFGHGVFSSLLFVTTFSFPATFSSHSFLFAFTSLSSLYLLLSLSLFLPNFSHSFTPPSLPFFRHSFSYFLPFPPPSSFNVSKHIFPLTLLVSHPRFFYSHLSPSSTPPFPLFKLFLSHWASVIRFVFIYFCPTTCLSMS